MTIAADLTPITTAPDRQPAAWRRLNDVVVLTRRNLVHVRREPEQLSDVTVQPVLFTVLFIYIFGSGIPIVGGTYKDYALAGLLVLNLTTSAVGTAVGLSSDMTTGAIDRFRALPIWRAAVLVGRTISDLLAAMVCTLIVALTGLVIGWRADAAIPSIVAGFAIALLFSFALSWGCACLGMVSKSPESAQGLGLIILFPMALVSNALVPTTGMPHWLQLIADWNPVSAVTAAARHLFGNPNPSGTLDVWPMQHPVAAALGWSVLILAVCGPLAVHLFRRRTTE